MGPRTIRRCVVALALLLLTAWPALAREDKTQPLTAEQKEKLKERDRLEAELPKLAEARKYEELLQTAERMARLSKEALGEDHPEVMESLERLARLQTTLERWEAGIGTRKEMLRIRSKRLGKEQWEVVDARRAVEEVERLARMTAEEREQVYLAQQLNQDAIELYRQGKHLQAARVAERALEVRKKVLGEEHPDYAASLNNLAFLEKSLGEYGKALPRYQRALEIHKKLFGEQHPAFALSLGNLAGLYKDMGEAGKALPLYQRALEVCKKALGEDHPLYAQSLNNLAELHRDLGEYGKALPLSQQALEVRKKTLGEEHPDYANSLSNLATLYRVMGEHGKALPLHQRALEIRKKALGEEHPDYAISLDNLAFLYREMGEYDKALPLSRQALEVFRKALGEDHRDYAKSLTNLVGLYQEMGEYRTALPLAQRALEINKKVLGEDHPDYASSLDNLAALHRYLGDYGKALPLCQRALEVNKKALGEEHPDYAKSLGNQAQLYEDMGEYGKALPLCRHALEVFKKALGEDHPEYAHALSNLAGLYRVMGEYGKALPLAQRALEIRKNTLGEEHPLYAHSLNTLASLYRSTGEPGQALPLYQRALEVRKKALGEEHPDYAISLSNLGLLYEDLGEYAKALPVAQRALEIDEKALGENHPEYATSVKNLAAVYLRLGERGKALELARRAQAIHTRSFDDRFTSLSEQRRGALLADVRGDLDFFLSLAPDTRDASLDCYTAVVGWKGVVAARRRDDRWLRDRPELREEYQKFQTARARLIHLADHFPSPRQHAAWVRRLGELREEKERLEAELTRRGEEFRRQREYAALTPGAVADALPEGVALLDLLEYDYLTPSTDPKEKGRWEIQPRLLGFVLRKGQGPVRVALGDAGAVRRAVAQWRAETQEKSAKADPRKLAEAASALRKQVWEPLAKHLGGAKTVLIAPDGALCQFPFAALPGSKEGTYLVEDYVIGYVTSAHQVVERRRRDKPRQEPKGLLAVGGIDYGAGKTFDPLPGAGLEAAHCCRQFRRAFPDERADLLDGGAATVDRVSKDCDSCRFLHLATHGYFESVKEVASRLSPAILAQAERDFDQAVLLARQQHELLVGLPLARCGLALAGANRGADPDQPDRPRGVLTGEDVEGLDLRGCELAVLSACQTGLGDLTQGDGVRGLQRAFAAAGAQSVAVSLWSVNDAATAVLMDQFYANLWDKKMGKLEALRQAQLFVLKHPDAVQKKGEELYSAAKKRGAPEELLRGPKGKLAVDLPDDGKRDPDRPRRSPEAWWAAFVLSGDWR